jgi:hypothetical protein
MRKIKVVNIFLHLQIPGDRQAASGAFQKERWQLTFLSTVPTLAAVILLSVDLPPVLQMIFYDRV